MNRRICRVSAGLILLCGWTAPAMAAELSDLMPAGTILYVGWPGTNAFPGDAKDTEWGKLMAEPEVVHFRNQWNKQIWPAIDKRIREELKEEQKAEAYAAVKDLLSAAWNRPVALGFAGFDLATQGPQVDAALIIRAGADARKLADQIGLLFQLTGKAETKEVQVGGSSLKEVALPDVPFPIRYGAMGEDLVVTIGPKFSEHWAAGAGAKTLTAGERFAAAMKATGGSGATPMFYVDIKGIVATIEKFQPMFAEHHVPVLGEPGGVQKIMDNIGLGTAESLSAATRQDANGFKTVAFLHAPGPKKGTLLEAGTLTDNDLKVVPKDAWWMTVSKANLAAQYDAIMKAFETLLPDIHKQVMPQVEAMEGRIGVRIKEDLLASFGDTWAFFDSPANGGVLFTGITIVGDLREGNKFNESMDKIVQAVAGMVGEEYPVTLRTDTFRDRKITFVNVGNAPMPIAPAWAEFNGKCIFGLYPQIVRATLDRLIDGKESILDNPDFQRGRKTLPAKFSSIQYVDTTAGLRWVYGLALPIGSIAASMVQGEDIPADITLFPSYQAITRHLFGNVATTTVDENGVLMVSHGPLPIAMNGASGGVAGAALGASIALPALARARESARRTVDMSNLKQISMACLIYAEKHKGELPPDLETLAKGEDRMLPDKNILRSPRDTSGSEISYVYVKSQANTMDPRNILAYEDPDKIDTSGGINVAFLDGHVQRMQMREFEKRLKETKARIKQQGGDAEKTAEEKEEEEEKK